MANTSIIKPKPKRLNEGQEALYRLIVSKNKTGEQIKAQEFFDIYITKVLQSKTYWTWLGLDEEGNRKWF